MAGTYHSFALKAICDDHLEICHLLQMTLEPYHRQQLLTWINSFTMSAEQFLAKPVIYQDVLAVNADLAIETARQSVFLTIKYRPTSSSP